VKIKPPTPKKNLVIRLPKMIYGRNSRKPPVKNRSGGGGKRRRSRAKKVAAKNGESGEPQTQQKDQDEEMLAADGSESKPKKSGLKKGKGKASGDVLMLNAEGEPDIEAGAQENGENAIDDDDGDEDGDEEEGEEGDENGEEEEGEEGEDAGSAVASDTLTEGTLPLVIFPSIFSHLSGVDNYLVCCLWLFD
jgi:hypothetical protein